MPNGKIGVLRRAVSTNTHTFEDFSAQYRELNLPPQQLRRLFEIQKRDKLYLTDPPLYQVAVNKEEPHGFPSAIVWHLSIKRIDKAPIHDWRDLQEIKNQLCGAECEAVELYPAETRVVDTSNQFHLYAFMRMGGIKLPRLPLGWTSGARAEKGEAGAVQRPRDEVA